MLTTRTLILAGAAGLAVSGVALGASETFNLGSPLVTDTPYEVNLNPVAAGMYTHATVSFDWVAGAGGPWSSEAIWALTDAPLLSAGTFYVDPGPSGVAASNGNPVTLTWDVYFSEKYTSNDPLWFLGLQTFGGSNATWNNLTVTIDSQAATGPTAFTDLGVVATTSDVFSINTFGSGFDTELGLFNSWGGLIDNNDDAGGTLQSEIAGLQLAAGEYYFNLGGFNTIYGAGGFEALVDAGLGSDGGTFVGDINGIAFGGTLSADSNVWYRFEVVPTPGAAVTFAMAGLFCARRRRA
ncbi:MAG: hypothetical protein ACF8QF_05890 [Phycisphaerales bacterium]